MLVASRSRKAIVARQPLSPSTTICETGECDRLHLDFPESQQRSFPLLYAQTAARRIARAAWKANGRYALYNFAVMSNPRLLLLIFLFGGFGTVARYLVAGWAQRISQGPFPFGTLYVNVIGCLLIGFLVAAFSGRWLVREEIRIAMLIGLLGGFTTYSAFGYETFALLNNRQYAHALTNIALSLFAGLAAVWTGYRLAERFLGV